MTKKEKEKDNESCEYTFGTLETVFPKKKKGRKRLTLQFLDASFRYDKTRTKDHLDFERLLIYKDIDIHYYLSAFKIFYSFYKTCEPLTEASFYLLILLIRILLFFFVLSLLLHTAVPCCYSFFFSYFLSILASRGNEFDN